MTRRSLSSLLALPAALAMRARSQSVAADASTTFDADGTARIKRTLPVPKTISLEAQALMVSGDRWVPQDGTKERIPSWKDAATYPVDIEDTTFEA